MRLDYLFSMCMHAQSRIYVFITESIAGYFRMHGGALYKIILLQ